MRLYMSTYMTLARIDLERFSKERVRGIMFCVNFLFWRVDDDEGRDSDALKSGSFTWKQK